MFRRVEKDDSDEIILREKPDIKGVEMDILKIFTGVSVAAAEIQKAMADKEITVKEMCDIVDNTLRATAGFGLDQVGFRVAKENGKTHISIVIGENKQ